MTRTSFLTLLSTLLIGTACGDDGGGDPNCTDGKCDDVSNLCTVRDLAGSTLLECAGASLDASGTCRTSNGQFAKKECCTFGAATSIKRGDQLAQRIINADSACPTSFREVMAELVASGCSSTETRVVETSAHHLDAAGLTGDALRDSMLFGGQVPETGGYHTVTSIECGQGAENRILFLQSEQFDGEPAHRGADGTLDRPGVADSSIWEKTGLRKEMEAIAWDPTGGPEIDGVASGVFNYYALEASDRKSATCKDFGSCATPTWAFHGNSAQFLDLDANLKPTGDFFGVTTGGTEQRRCAECHTGGGIIMRELNSPWINWEEDFFTPGARGLLATHAEVLGDDLSSSSGADQEFTIVGGGNRLWDGERIKIANSPEAVATPNALLKPLFCSVEINLQTSFSSNVSSFSSSVFFDPTLSSMASADLRVSISNSTYADAVSAGQVIPRITNGTGATGLDAPFNNVPGFGVIDTAGGFMVPERSGADMEYLERLESAGVIDSALTKAVLSVDFTRPIFSPTRCDVLGELALTWDDLGGAVTDAAKIRGVVTTKLQALADAGNISAGGQELLANLAAPGDIDTRMDSFAAACQARATDNEADFVSDVLHVANVNREKAYELPIYQLIPSSMPASPGFAIGLGPFRPSSGHETNARLNAVDCTLESLSTGQ